MLDFVRNSLEKGDDTLAILLLTLTGLVALLLIGWLVMAVRLRTLSRRLNALTRGHDDQSMEEVLTSHLDTIHQTVRRMETLEQAVGVLQAQMPGCIQRASLVRYDAFDDVGGEQSFSVALLDGRGDGIVLTSVYSRMDVRVYAKSIRNGQASHVLSQEEERALREIAVR